ncbi:UDP-3-O-(3-hydroxymyristoyl)glucosamine N-acyltransferase [bacterium]|nr:UDP-3-O-(3-hydroxymyristoyl)glucosamine N-acyltransferase [bacterium]
MKLGDIAHCLRGQLVGDSTLPIDSIGALGDGPSDLTFVMDAVASRRLDPTLHRAVVAPFLIPQMAHQVVVSNPRWAMAHLIPLFFPLPSRIAGVSPLAVVSDGAAIHPSATVDAGAVIEAGVTIGADTHVMSRVTVLQSVSIGDGCVLYPGVVVYPRSVIGHRVCIHANAVIGSDGFGYVAHEGQSVKMPHVGRAVIGDECEIGAGACIDRSVLGDTVLGKGVKLDNMVHIAHHCRVGEGSVVAAMTGLTGGVSIGKGVQIGGQAGLANATIGDGAVIAARAGVTTDVPPGAVVSGFPAWSHRKELIKEAWLRKMSQTTQRRKP